MGTLQQDREDYAAWVAWQLARIEHYGATGNGFDVWDHGKMEAAGVWREPADAYRGPWRAVKPYATREFIWWIEAEREPRYTFTEWRERARLERERQATADQEWQDSADYCLSELEVLRELLARRDELIAAARDRGAAWGAICEASGLSRMQAHTVAKQHRQRERAGAQIAGSADAEPGVELRVIDGEMVEVF